MKRAYFALVLGAAALAAACSDTTTATRSLKPGSGPAAAVVPGSGTIDQDNPITDGACVETEWHWVINGLDKADAPASITAHFQTAGDVVVPLDKWAGPPSGLNGVAQYTLPASSVPGDVLTATGATATLSPGVSYTNFRLSHRPCEAVKPQGSQVVTEVHAADHTAISDASPAALGTTAHDKATVTTTDASAIPTGSTVTFRYFSGNTCSELVAGPTGYAASGSSPLVVEDGLPQGPLGPGEYSYKAVFTSGDPTKVSDSEGECEPFKVNKGTLHITTTPHDASHAATTSVALGSVMHDVATVTGEVSGFTRAPTTFTFSANGTCAAGSSIANAGSDGGGEKSADTSPLGAGSYSFLASVASDANYDVVDDTGCEPFTVNKANVTISTNVHNALHANITNNSVVVGSSVHDTATVGGAVTGFPITGTVTFAFFASPVGPNASTCSTTPTGSQGVTLPAGESSPQQINASGNYAYSASYGGDANYNASNASDCEPFTIFQLGKSQGFYGSSNGVAAITAFGGGNTAAGYLAAATAIGRGSSISTQGDAAKVLPNQTNACGSGLPFIFVVGAQTASQPCTLSPGLNIGTLNTGSSQTLALSYNVKTRPGYTGQTIGAMLCSANITAVLLAAPVSLTASSTVNEAFTAAFNLIDKSYASGGTTTQSQLGAMNGLLSCLNREVP